MSRATRQDDDEVGDYAGHKLVDGMKIWAVGRTSSKAAGIFVPGGVLLTWWV